MPEVSTLAWMRRARAASHGAGIVILYHRTTKSAAAAILRSGFKDRRGTYLTDQEFEGVWLSDRPLDGNEIGAAAPRGADVPLCVEIEESTLAFEWVEDGKPYREVLVPVGIVNRGLGRDRPGGRGRHTPRAAGGGARAVTPPKRRSVTSDPRRCNHLPAAGPGLPCATSI